MLREYGITAVIDVRSNPHSAYYKFFDSDSLSKLLLENNIKYLNFDVEFGARQPDIKYYSNVLIVEKSQDGKKREVRRSILDFEKFIESEEFTRGVKRIKTALKENYTVCLMCAEKDPISCHRAIMCGQGLKNNGINVTHILSGENNSAITQDELEQRLVDLHVEKKGQMDFFTMSIDNRERVRVAYRKQNELIGNKLEDLN